MTFYVYSIINLYNGKVYIGKTNNIKKRWRDHISISKKENHKDYQLIHKAINKYGKNNFQFNIIQIFENESYSYHSEKYWIDYYKSYIVKYGKNYGYNLTEGGIGTTSPHLSGVRNPKNKLSENQIIEIKSSNLGTKELSKFYKVHRTTIQKIRRGDTWNIMNNIPQTPLADILKNFYEKRKGENSPAAKLNWAVVDTIRKDFGSKKYTISELSRQYKVSWTTIKSIVSSKSWIKEY